MQSIFLRYLCSKMVGQQFSPEQRKFMALSYHQTGSQVFKTPPANVDELRERIVNEFVALRRTRMAGRAMRDMRTRAIRCVELEGGHVEGRN